MTSSQRTINVTDGSTLQTQTLDVSISDEEVGSVIAAMLTDIPDHPPPSEKKLEQTAKCLAMYAAQGSPMENMTLFHCGMVGSAPLHKFKLCLPPLIICLQTLDKRKQEKLWPESLSLIAEYVQKKDIPKKRSGEEDELLGLCMLILENLEHLVRRDPDAISTESRRFVSNTCLHLLSHPFSSMDMSETDLPEISAVAAVKFSDLVLELKPDFMSLLKQHLPTVQDDGDLVRSPAKEGVALMFYLFIRELLPPFLPMCLHWKFVFLTFAPTLTKLLNRTKDSILDKALTCSQGILDRISKDSLESDFVSFADTVGYVKALVSVLSFCPEKTVRKRALGILDKFSQKLEFPARPLFFTFVSNNAHHSGLRGWVIGKLKDSTLANIAAGGKHEDFKGPKLERQIRSLLRLPKEREKDSCPPENEDDAEGIEDVLTWSEEILASLNCMYVLGLRDVDNVVGIKEIEVDFKNGYIQSLERQLRKQKIHFNDEMELHPDVESVRIRLEQAKNQLGLIDFHLANYLSRN